MPSKRRVPSCSSFRPVNLRNLGYLLSIEQASSVADAELAKIAARKANARYNPVFSPTWYATWVGVDPVAAIPALAARLAALDKPAKQTNLALRFVAAVSRRVGLGSPIAPSST